MFNPYYGDGSPTGRRCVLLTALTPLARDEAIKKHDVALKSTVPHTVAQMLYGTHEVIYLPTLSPTSRQVARSTRSRRAASSPSKQMFCLHRSALTKGGLTYRTESADWSHGS